MITVKVRDTETLAILLAKLAEQGVTANVIEAGGYWLIEITGT